MSLSQSECSMNVTVAALSSFIFPGTIHMIYAECRFRKSRLLRLNLEWSWIPQICSEIHHVLRVALWVLLCRAILMMSPTHPQVPPTFSHYNICMGEMNWSAIVLCISLTDEGTIKHHCHYSLFLCVTTTELTFHWFIAWLHCTASRKTV